MHLAKGRTARYKTTAQVISWEAAAERIGQLMQDGKYASNVELVEAEGHERMKLSHLLWYLRGDLSDEAREQNILSTLADYRRNGFPDATARLAEDLKDPAFRERLAADYTAFLEAYQEDRRIMRFNYHHPHEIWNRLKDLDLPRREYTSDMAEVSKVGMFITEDEIDATLAGGSNVEGGKGRIYGYLTSAHNAKEKADFLKNEYGISGSSHAVSGRGWRDSNGKGIRLQKPDCADVELNWHKVLARFENIIRNGRYFTPEEQAKYDEMQTREWQFRKHMDAYNDIKHDHPDDIVLFQVGDFFEMYGEDAKTASELLDLNLTTRPVAGAGRVDMCGIPGHRLEQFVEKLRETNSVAIARHNSIINEHTTYSLGVLGADKEIPQEVGNEPVGVSEAPTDAPKATAETPVVSREITQAEIDEALQNWNGDIASKRAVVRYMADHARERDTAAWLSKEYGGDVSKSLHITVTGTDIDYEMSWAKVQRRIAQLIKEDRFYTQEEYDRLDDVDPIAVRETLAERGIVNGELVDPEALERDPFIQQVVNDAEQISREQTAMDAPDRYSIRLHPNEGGITGIWDAALDRFYEEGNQVLRFAEQDNAIQYLANIQRTHGMEPTAPIFTTPTGRAYRIGDGISSAEVEHKETVIVIDRVDEGDVWYTLPSVPEQEAVKIDRTAFERYLDTGYFSVVEQEQERTIQAEPRDPASGVPFKVGDTVYLDDTAFEITNIGLFDVQLRDPSLAYPIFRAESKERLMGLLHHDERNQSILDRDVPHEEQFTTETVAVYPGEKNNLPYDVVIQTIRTNDPEPDKPKPELHNFQITDDHLGEGGAKAKFRMNMDAINLLKELEFDGRQATPEEQVILSKYVGWGGLADAFDETKDNWKNEFAELYATLSPEEYAAARSSTLNAHYTSPTVIKAIYEAVGNMGFETGNILEPSMGVGNFFGCLPEAMQNLSLIHI